MVKRMLTMSLALVVVGLAAAGCSSAPTAQKPPTSPTTTSTTASTTTSSSTTGGITTTTTAGEAPCFAVFANVNAISTGDLKPYRKQIADNCSPSDLLAVVTQRVEYTADGRPLNGIGQAVVSGAVALTDKAVCPSNPHTKLCP